MPSESELEFLYFTELTRPLNNGDYTLLLLNLFNKLFYYSIPNDENRVRDALFNRQLNDIHNVYIDKPVNVLEILVTLAKNAEDIMHDTTLGDRTSVWFWLMLRNLGLDFLTNDNWTADAENYVDIVINRWLDRRFDERGHGSPFPINRSRVDMRSVEIWDQLQWYFAEKFELEEIT